MKKKRKISLIISILFFFVSWFVIADYITCTDVSKQVCFYSSFFNPLLILFVFVDSFLFFIGVDRWVINSGYFD